MHLREEAQREKFMPMTTKEDDATLYFKFTSVSHRRGVYHPGEGCSPQKAVEGTIENGQDLARDGITTHVPLRCDYDSHGSCGGADPQDGHEFLFGQEALHVMVELIFVMYYFVQLIAVSFRCVQGPAEEDADQVRSGPSPWFHVHEVEEICYIRSAGEKMF